MKVFITGVAGFIGMHTADRLLSMGIEVSGIDNINDYYDPSLKLARLNYLKRHSNFHFIQGDILDAPLLSQLFQNNAFDAVLHFAAQAGVRHSTLQPQAFIDTNVTGFLNILEVCRQFCIAHLIFASSSSVYGANNKLPFSEDDATDQPLSPYGASKKAGELLAFSYSHLYGIPITGLRFFTVYGPWGRPDQAPFLFLKAALSYQPIKVFNHGQMTRDFTYIDDVVNGIIQSLKKLPNDPSTSQFSKDEVSERTLNHSAPYKIFNIGNSEPMPLLTFIQAIETELSLEIEKQFLPLQDGDVLSTHADIRKFQKWVNFQPTTPVMVGVRCLVKWYRNFYRV